MKWIKFLLIVLSIFFFCGNECHGIDMTKTSSVYPVPIVKLDNKIFIEYAEATKKSDIKLKNTGSYEMSCCDSIILISEDLYNRLGASTPNPIDKYCSSIRRKYNRLVAVVKFPSMEISPSDLRETIKGYYDNYWKDDSSRYHGIILVGQWPLAVWNVTLPWGTHVGPMMGLYMDLDQDAYEIAEDNTFNKRKLTSDYQHSNISWLDQLEFNYGVEIWCTLWRAVGIKNPPADETEQIKEVQQITDFINKCVDYHNRGGYLPNSKYVCGLYHEYYKINTDITSTTYGSTGRLLNLHYPGWYHATGSADYFMSLFVSQEFFAFDPWTHANPWELYADKNLSGIEIYNAAQSNVGPIISLTFGCSSGDIVTTETYDSTNYRSYNYANTLIMSRCSCVLSIGSGWSYGMSYPFKTVFYDQILMGSESGQAIVVTENEEMAYGIHYSYPEEDITPFIYFGDPYFKIRF